MPAKVYDRPEGASKSPLLIVVAVIVVVLLGFLVYRWKFAPAAAPSGTANPSGTGQSSLFIRRDTRVATVRHIPESLLV